jgi:hypothetical protein
MVRDGATFNRSTTVERIVVGTNDNGTPILIRDIGNVHLGPDLRRGLVELDGNGEVAGASSSCATGHDTAELEAGRYILLVDHGFSRSAEKLIAPTRSENQQPPFRVSC